MSFSQWFRNKRQQNTVELACDVIQTLFPVNETICTGIECYLCYGKGPWGFRFRFKGKGIHSSADYTRSLGTEDSRVNSHKGIVVQRFPRFGRTRSCSRADVAGSLGIPGRSCHQSSEPPDWPFINLCSEGTWNLPALAHLSFTVRPSQTQEGSSPEGWVRALLHVLGCRPSS